MGDWCILRTSPSRTQALVTSLTEVGVEAWTPIGIIIERDGDRRTRKETRGPLMPRYVFARADRAYDLHELSRAPSLLYRVWDSEQQKMVTHGHPPFIILRSGERFSLVAERALEPLREAETRDRPKVPLRAFVVGERVRASDDGHVGLTGTIVWAKGRKAKVEFAKNWIVELETWLLTPAIDDRPSVHVSSGVTEQALSARAA